MAFTNGAKPRVVGTISGAPPRIETTLEVNTGTVAPGDFVILSSGKWEVWADSGTIGGIYLGTDQGYATEGAVSIGTPGIDASGQGVMAGDGGTAANTTGYKYGAVLVLTPDLLVELDIKEGLTMTTVLPGAIVGGVDGATYVSPSSGGWYFELNATTDVDSLCTVVEVLQAPAAALRGRIIVRFHNPALLVPGA